MRIVFFDLIDFDYSAGTVFEAPLGGSQSALSYLAMNLANLGHDIFLINKISSPTVSHGVACLPISCVSNKFWVSVDFIICFNGANSGEILRQLCGEKANIILWNQHAHDQPAIQRLSEKKERESYDYFLFISNWQAEKFIETFGIKREKIVIFRNAIGHNFEDLFDAEISILEQKVASVYLAYTSTPFRGLSLLVDIFPKLREKFPDIKLKIFSSMKVYQLSDEKDNQSYGDLYKTFKAMDGVEYIGSVSQPKLVQELKNISILAYPNTFPETSCIAVMEAMASGCHVITSNLGALPETTAGFATLVPFNPDLDVYKQDFGAATIEYIERLQSGEIDGIEEQLSRQVKYCQQNYTWKKRAHEWLEKLYEIRGYKFFCFEDYQSAIILYEEAITAYPDNIVYYCYLVLALAIIGDQETAISTLLLYFSNNKIYKLLDLQSTLERIVELETQRLMGNNNQDALKAVHEFISLLE
jgi:glycosyltransferase involved in cell wall biosynthesis